MEFATVRKIILNVNKRQGSNIDNFLNSLINTSICIIFNEKLYNNSSVIYYCFFSFVGYNSGVMSDLKLLGLGKNLVSTGIISK